MLKIILIILLLIIFGVGIIFFINQYQFNATTNPTQIIQPREKIRLVGDKVYLFSEDKPTLYNVSGVSEVKLGPDGQSIHFKLSKPNYQARCLYLGSVIEQSPVGYPSPPPFDRPWDYTKIGYAYTVGGCNGSEGNGGFLQNANLFAYLKESSGKVNLIVDNLEPKKTNTIDIPMDIFKKPSPEVINNPVEDGMGNKYYYSKGDAIVPGNKLLLSFGNLIIGVDLNKNQFIGDIDTINNPNIIASSYVLLSDKNSPYVVVSGRWEGPETLAYILDMSGNELKSFKLYPDYMNNTFANIFFPDIKPYEWKSGELYLNDLNTQDILKDLPKDFQDKTDKIYNEQTNLSDDQWTELDNQAEDILNKDHQYQDVACLLSPGMYTPSCLGLIGINQYKYTSQGLQKTN